MVAIFIVFCIIACLTVDIIVQRLSLRRAAVRAGETTRAGETVRAGETTRAGETVRAGEAARAVSAVPRFAARAPARLPATAFVDAGHTWVELEPGGTATVGIDPLPGALLGGVERLELLAPGTEVARGQPLLTLHRGGRQVLLRSPIDGAIVEVEPAAAGAPVAAPSSFENRWIYRMKPRELGPALRAMRVADEATEWLGRETSRLRDAVMALARPESAVGATLLDGGVPAENLAAGLDDKAWLELVERFLGPGQPRPKPGRNTDHLA